MAVGFDAGYGFDSALVGFDGNLQLGVDDLRVELFYAASSGKTWANITSYVLVEEGIQVTRGRTNEDGDPSPSSCSLSLDNRTGIWSPRNTAGSLYGKIGRNTPLRVGLGTPAAGVGTTGTGTSVTAPTISLSMGTVGLMVVGVTLPTDNLTTPAGFSNATEQDAALFTVKRAHQSGAATPAGAATFTAGTGTTWAACQIAVPGGTYSASGGATADSGNSPSGVGLGAVADGAWVVAVCAWTTDAQGRMLPPFMVGGTVPVEMYSLTDTGPSATAPRLTAWAFQHRTGAGDIYFTGAQDGSTGATIQVSSWTTTANYSPRFSGEIADWPVRWDYAEAVPVTDIQASGVLRRLAQQTDIKSPLRSALASSTDITAYWPMEDPEGSLGFAPAIGYGAMVPVGVILPGQVDAVAGSLPLPDFTACGARGYVTPGNGGPWGFGGVVAIPTAGTASGTNLFTGECGGPTGTITSIGLEYTSNTVLTLKHVIAGVTTSASLGSLVTAFPNGINGKQILVYIAAAQNAGNIDMSVTVINITPTETVAQLTGTTSPAGTINNLQSVTACVEVGGNTIGTNSISAGHVFVTESATLSFATYRRAAARGYAGSVITEAAIVIARDAGVQITLCYPTGDTRTAGVVGAQLPAEALRDLATAGQAFCQDAAGFPGLEYRPLTSIVSHAPSWTLAYTDGLFCEAFGPVDDDATTLNDVTVTSTTAGEARSQILTGNLGAQPGGVGRYARQYTLPVPDAVDAGYLAQWMTGQGTIDAARYPYLTLRMSKVTPSYDPAALSIGDTIRVTGMPTFQGVAAVNLVIVGFQETFDSQLWSLGVVTRLAAGYDVLIWDDATFGDWDEHQWSL